MGIGVITGATATRIRSEGREYLYFGGCDYLGLAHHPAVIAAMAAPDGFGVGIGASRRTSGDAEVYGELERAIAGLVGAEACAILPDGFLANVAAAAAVGPGVAWVDAGAHPSLLCAARAAGMEVRQFPHAGVPAGGSARREAVVLSDAVFAESGVARVSDLAAWARAARGLAILDDCHGVGVLGAGGAGTCAHIGVRVGDEVVVTGTLAKALGCAGGFVAGAAGFVERVRGTTAYVCTTPIPSRLARAGVAAIRVVREEPQRLARLQVNAERVRAILAGLGIEARGDLPAFWLGLGSAEPMRRVFEGLLDAGVLVPLIEYPGVGVGERFRLAVNAEHTDRDLVTLEGALRKTLGK